MEAQTQKQNLPERMQASFSRQGFMSLIGAQMTGVSEGFCEIVTPYRQELTQQHAYFHGGVTATLADNASGYAAYTVMPEDASVLSVEFKINFIAPAVGDELVARAKVVKNGRRLKVVQCDVFGRTGAKEIHAAASLATIMCLEGASDAPALRADKN